MVSFSELVMGRIRVLGNVADKSHKSSIRVARVWLILKLTFVEAIKPPNFALAGNGPIPSPPW